MNSRGKKVTLSRKARKMTLAWIYVIVGIIGVITNISGISWICSVIEDVSYIKGVFCLGNFVWTVLLMFVFIAFVITFGYLVGYALDYIVRKPHRAKGRC